MFKIILSKYCTQRLLNVSEKFINRNPRNLELLRYDGKTKGWELQAPLKNYYLKCIILEEKQNSTAIIQHVSGEILIKVSTKDPAINSKLLSKTDVCAMKNIGSILSHRCLQAGISAVFFDWQGYSNFSKKVLAFCSAMEQGGILLKEPDVIEPPCQIGVDYDSISEEERLRLTDSKLIDHLKHNPDNNRKSVYWTNMRFNPDEKRESRHLAYEKIQNGMWWSDYYKVLIHPHNLPHWHENAVHKRKPVTVDDYLPELETRYKALNGDE